MDLIAQHPYIKTERKVTSTGKYEIEDQRHIYLYKDKVVTEHREFPIEYVMDFSYREVAGQGGVLYLHAAQGVFSYVVKTSPANFIKAYQEHFK